MTPANRFAFALLFGGLLTAQTSSQPDMWEPIRFLIGVWEGQADGKPGTGRTEREYRFVLNKKFLEVRNKSVYPAQPKNPKGEVHEDWGMISYDRSRKKLVFPQFHVECFVNHYATEAGPDKLVRFNSETIENIPAGFRTRETYTVKGPNEFVERFEMAEPGKDFELYTETHFKRKVIAP